MSQITIEYKPSSSKNLTWQYLLSINSIRKHLCFGCVFSKLYDKDNKEYLINHHLATVEEAKAIVEEIKRVNECE